MNLKFKAGIFFSLLVLLGVAAQPSRAVPPGGYTLVWHDEFNSGTDPLETVGAPPDPAYWNYDLGNNGGWGNSELETYTSTNATIVTDAGAANGTALDIQATKSGGNYFSSRIKTNLSTVIGTQPQYGYFEAQIQGPSGSGLWPAWWMMGEDLSSVGWPEAGEQDLYEQFENTPTTEFSTVHFGTSDNGLFTTVGNTSTLTAGVYNIYGYLWTPTVQQAFVNGSAIGGGISPTVNALTAAGTGAFSQPFFFLLNMAVGGTPVGTPPISTTFPADYKIGYIRSYQPTGSVQTITNAADATPPTVAGGSHPLPNGVFQIAPEVSPGGRLNLIGNNTSGGTGIDVEGSNGGASQLYTFSTTGVTPSGDYTIKADGSFCLQAGGWSLGSSLEIWSCNGSTLQSWNVVSSTPVGYFQLKPASSNSLCAYISTTTDIGGFDYVDLNTCDTTGNDEWAFGPSAPTSLVATAHSNQVVLTWNASAGAAAYRVYRTLVSGSETTPTLAGGLIVTTFTDNGAVNGTKYYYTVTAVASGGQSPQSNEVNATPEPAVPSAPSALTAIAAANGVTPIALTWTASVGATGYSVYRTTGAGSTTVLIGGSGAAPTVFSYSDLFIQTPNTTVSSVARAFVNGDVGSLLVVTGGTGFTTGSYRIVSVSGGVATLSAAVGTLSSSGGVATLIGQGTFSDPGAGLVPGSTYTYTVTAVNGGGASGVSNASSVLLSPAPALSLTGLSMDHAVSLSWNASPGATKYRVFRSTSSNTEANPTLAGGLTGTTYTDSAAVNGTAYYYKVTALNTAGVSGFSNEFGPVTPGSTAPLAPTGLTATAHAGGTGPIALSWTASAGALKYRVFRSTVSGTEGNPTLAAGLTGTTYSDASVTAGVTYYYKVAAVNTGGQSPLSNEANATLTPVPALSLIATAAAGGVMPIALSWTASPGATGYTVYRSTVVIGTATSPATTFSDTAALAAGGTYSYSVTATNVGGTSAASNTASATLAPPAATGLTATGVTGAVTLSWTGSAGATKYRVFRSTASNTEANPTLAGGLTTTTYTDSSAVVGTLYYYKVTALNTAGVSGFSNEGGPAAALPNAPPIPQNLIGTAGEAEMQLSWNASTGASSYSVYRGTAPAGEGATAIASGITITNYTDLAAADGITWYYVVKAFVGPGVGAYSGASNEVSGTPDPQAPNLSVLSSAGASPVILGWTSSTGATSYTLYRGTAVISSNSLNTTYTDSGVVAGSTYTYTVKAVDAPGSSPASNAVTVTIIPAIPALTATNGVSQVSLSWTASAGTAAYRLYRSTSGGAFPNLLVGGLTTTTYTDTGGTTGVTYFYQVTAVNTGGASAASNQVSGTFEPAAPAAPAALTATAGDTTVALSWTASAGATGYNIFRGVTSGGEGATAIAVAGTTYTDSGLTDGTTYYYKVKAVNGGGSSTTSPEANAKPVAPAPPALTNLVATPGNAVVTLTWTAAPRATSYNVLRGNTSGSEVFIVNVPGPTYTNTLLSNGQTYFYEVQGVDTGGTAAISNEASATPVSPPAAPTSLHFNAVAGATPVNLGWTAGAGATGYNIYRSTSSGTETLLSTSASTTASDAGAVAGGTYFYKVAGVNAGGTSVLSLEITETIVPGAPVLSVTSGAGANPVKLTWTAGAGATGYNLYRGTSSGTETLLASGATSVYTDSGVSAGDTWFYYVSAVDGGGATSSNEVSATVTPAVPVGLSITSANGATPVTLAWTATAGATGYGVYRSTSSGTEVLIATSVTAAYTDGGVAPGRTYFYTVASVNAGGTSAQSIGSEVSETITPAAPTGLAVSVTANSLDNSVHLTWTASTGAGSYSIYRATTPGGEAVYFTGVVGTVYNDNAATQAGGTLFYYKVSALNGGGASPLSAESASANTCATIDAPTSPAVVNDAGGVGSGLDFSWTNSLSTYVTSYNIYSNTTGGPFPGSFLTNGVSPYHDTTATGVATTYYYQVTSTDSCGVVSGPTTTVSSLGQ